MSVPEQLSTIDRSQVANLSGADVKIVQADMVRMYHTDAEVVTAEEVELERSAVGNLKARHVSVQNSLLATVSAAELSSERTGMVYVRAEKAALKGYMGAVVAGSAQVQPGLTGVVAGNEVRVDGATSLLLLAKNVTGSVVTLMDARTALITGLTGGLFAGLMFLFGRALFGRK